MAKFSHIVNEDPALIAEAFNQPPFETEMFKKGAGDVYFTFESGGDTFRIQFYTSGGLGKNVRRVYIGTKQGAGYKDVIKKFDNPAKIIATLIDATEKYLQTPLGKSIDGLMFDLSKKASPKGTKLLRMVLKRSKVFKRYMETVDVEIEVDKGRSATFAIRKGKNASDVFNGKKVEGLIPSDDPVVEPEPEEDDLYDMFGDNDPEPEPEPEVDPDPEHNGIRSWHNFRAKTVPLEGIKYYDRIHNHFMIKVINGDLYEVTLADDGDIVVKKDREVVAKDKFWGALDKFIIAANHDANPRNDPMKAHIYNWEEADKIWKAFLDERGVPYERKLNKDRPLIGDGGGVYYTVNSELFVEIKHDGYEAINIVFGYLKKSAKDPKMVAEYLITQYKEQYPMSVTIKPSEEMFVNNVDLDDRLALEDLIINTVRPMFDEAILSDDMLDKMATKIAGEEVGKLTSDRNKPIWDQILAGSVNQFALENGLNRMYYQLHTGKLAKNFREAQSGFDQLEFSRYMASLQDNSKASDYFVKDSTERLVKYSDKNLTGRETDLITREMHKILKLSGGRHTILSFKKTNSRAYHTRGGGNAYINIGSYLDSTTLWHEMGHDIEDTYPSVHRQCVQFLLDRAQKVKDINRPVNDMGRMGTGVKGEWALDAPFFDDYAGRLYLPDGLMHDDDGNPEDPHNLDTGYLLERIGKVNSTEVLSMGLQYFYKADRAAELYRKDPELFDFVRKIIEEVSQ